MTRDTIKFAQEIELARTGYTPAVVLRKAFKEVPSWDDFITFIHSRAHDDADWVRTNEPFIERVVNSLIVRNMFYFHAPDPDVYSFPQTQAIYDALTDIVGEIRPSMAFVNFVGGEKELDVHLDNRETLYWQCIGNSTWKIYGKDGKELVQSYVLKPGDMIFVPNGTWHTVETPTPRAAIVLEHV